MANKAKRHTHKYHKIALTFGRVWACALPDCNHYMPQHMEAMVPGKASICWKCEEQMILNSENMKDTHPKCDVCSGLADTLQDINLLLNEKGA